MNKMKKKVLMMTMAAVTLSAVAQQPVDYVNPIIGTDYIWWNSFFCSKFCPALTKPLEQFLPFRSQIGKLERFFLFL